MAYITDSFDEEITRLLKNGGVGVLPTDTIYGISCRALNELSVERLHKLKDRQAHKPFIVLISDLKQLNSLGVDPKHAQPVTQYWPGHLSVIFESTAPTWLQRGTNTLAIRLPDYQPLLNLIHLTGPLVSTSANLEGQPPANRIEQAKEYFGEHLDFYVDAGKLESKPSTVAKLNFGQLEIIRQGAVKIK